MSNARLLDPGLIAFLEKQMQEAEQWRQRIERSPENWSRSRWDKRDLERALYGGYAMGIQLALQIARHGVPEHQPLIKSVLLLPCGYHIGNHSPTSGLLPDGKTPCNMCGEVHPPQPGAAAAVPWMVSA